MKLSEELNLNKLPNYKKIGSFTYNNFILNNDDEKIYLDLDILFPFFNYNGKEFNLSEKEFQKIVDIFDDEKSIYLQTYPKLYEVNIRSYLEDSNICNYKAVKKVLIGDFILENDYAFIKPNFIHYDSYIKIIVSMDLKTFYKINLQDFDNEVLEYINKLGFRLKEVNPDLAEKYFQMISEM